MTFLISEEEWSFLAPDHPTNSASRLVFPVTLFTFSLFRCWNWPFACLSLHLASIQSFINLFLHVCILRAGENPLSTSVITSGSAGTSWPHGWRVGSRLWCCSLYDREELHLFCITSFAQMTNPAWRCIFNILEICPAVLAYCVVVGQNVVQSLASRAAPQSAAGPAAAAALQHNTTILLTCFPALASISRTRRVAAARVGTTWRYCQSDGETLLTSYNRNLLRNRRGGNNLSAAPRLTTSPPRRLTASSPVSLFHCFPQFLTFISM